ncbi:tRNA lysidine(34) synthetase TilS [Thiorhodococcus mannitoliphagus]|uniref:tRNA(Ile)-lysidine synthase n=1 Tax=Thiorhodococcus mannitoliphagus TaxID=329406 RepID=A0A6P1DYA7_9GAMM|nr:tRNA lysidine(34) synthetase TilS [Thiorhodococcus mannitoliphagus]NEX22679.1 tRNA lysidine(34) synthetase TilS [Thiorhodococcus mannitoliphagus]
MSGLDSTELLSLLESYGDATCVWVAFSGGMDSAALLESLLDVRDALPGKLQALHVDHGLHPQSQRWAEHCAAFCRSRAVPLAVERIQITPSAGESLEALAREARYAAFSRLLGRRELILTAHHQDDQAETLLLALMRGSGVRGLSAMPVSARLGRGHLIRPLLGCSRAEIARFAAERNLDWIEDPSNAQTHLDRNFLRHCVLPMLQRRWPAASATISRSARHCAEAAWLVEGLANDVLPQLLGGHPGTLSIEMLSQLNRALQKAAVRAWLELYGFVLPDTRHLERILDEVAPARPDARPLVAWKGCQIRRYRDDLFCMEPLPEPPPRTLRLEWRLGETPTMLELPSGLGRLEWHPEPGVSTLARQPPTPLEVRFAQRGCRCRTRLQGHARPLKDHFQAAAVPDWLRPYAPMVLCDDRLVAVAGVCGCLTEEGGGVQGRLVWRGLTVAPLAGVFQREIAVSLPSRA